MDTQPWEAPVKRPAAKPESEAEQKRLILWPWIDFLEQGGLPAVAEYAAHVGVDLDGTASFEKAVLAHYKIGARRYDIKRAAADLARWPPVANHIDELTTRRATPR
jgi:hypothetical protein